MSITTYQKERLYQIQTDYYNSIQPWIKIMVDIENVTVVRGRYTEEQQKTIDLVREVIDGMRIRAEREAKKVRQ